MFLLFEDEFGTINLIVPRAVYERHRPLARAEPMLLARGRLERSRQPPGPDERAEDVRPVINVIVRELEALERHLQDGLAGEDAAASGRVRQLPGATPAAQDASRALDADERDAGGHDAGALDAEEEAAPGTEIGSSIRAAAPPVQSFAMGRRR